MENELTKDNADYSEWYAVLCEFAKRHGSNACDGKTWLEAFEMGLTPAESWSSTCCLELEK